MFNIMGDVKVFLFGPLANEELLFLLRELLNVTDSIKIK